MISIKQKLQKPLGEFQVLKWKGGKTVYDSGVRPNVVTNHFWGSVMATNNNQHYRTGDNVSEILYRCLVSSDTSEVDVSDNVMPSVVGNSYSTARYAFTMAEINGKSYYRIGKRFLWPTGAFNGTTITKVGIDRTNNNTGLICGQLIRDPTGDPVAITVQEDEQLDIRYYIHIPVFEETSTETTAIVNGIEHPVVITLRNNLAQHTSAPYFGMSFWRSTSTYSWFINSTSFSQNLITEARTQYETSTEKRLSMIVDGTTNLTTINTIEPYITNFAAGSSGTGGMRLLELYFPDSQLSKLNTDSLSLEINLTYDWS